MRLPRLTLVALLLSPLPGLAPADPPADALVGYWRFDERHGEKVVDASPAGNDGTLHGAKRAEGKTGGAVDCGQDRFAEVPHSKILDDFSRGVTVCAWVKRADDATWNTDCFHGRIDEVRLYARALNAAEVAAVCEEKP